MGKKLKLQEAFPWQCSQFLAGLVLLVFASLLASILLFNLGKRMQGGQGESRLQGHLWFIN